MNLFLVCFKPLRSRTSLGELSRLPLKRCVLAGLLLTAGLANASAMPPLSVGSHDTDIDGTRIHYTVVGTGPVLVIQAPGWGIGTSYLEAGLAPLAQHFTLVTYDPRNSGQSVRVADPQRLNTSDMADDLEKLRRVWQLEKMDLLGHSHGGAVALAYAERYPDRVRHLVLVGAQVIGYSGAVQSQTIAARQKADPAFRTAYSGPAIPTDNDDRLRAEFRRTFIVYLHDPVRSRAALEATLPDGMVASSQNAERQIAGSPPLHEVDDLSKVSATTLLIVGRDDIACPPMVSARVHRGVRGSSLSVYEESGHFPWIEEPSRFFAEVEKFLDN